VFIFLNSVTKKITLVGCHPQEGVNRWGKETTAKKGHHYQEAVTKKVVSFFGRATPSIAAPGDTKPSDATGRTVGGATPST